MTGDEPDDLGLRATKLAVRNAQMALAQKFDEVVSRFIEAIEERKLDLNWDAPVIRHCGHIVRLEGGDDDWSYFVWRSPQRGTHVLRYRFLSNFLANQNTHVLSADFTLQSQKIEEEYWPEPLKLYINNRPDPR